ncbi:MAG TPA: ACT domain-containing protein [Armatimonadota bacterium]|jgi:glycine cleavage system transcriptional repressor
MTPLFVITAVGQDRPGIIASVTKALWDCGCNLEDTSMTRLRNEFAMILLARGGPGLRLEQLQEHVRPALEELGLTSSFRCLEPGEDGTTAADAEKWLITVYGGDKPGIVHRVAALLASQGCNVTDVVTRAVGQQDSVIYIMHLEVVPPTGADPDQVDALLKALGLEIGVEISLQEIDEDIL